MLEGRKVEVTQELIDIFEPDEGSVNMYYGRIGNGKTYAATADVLELLRRGRIVYVNWHIQYDGFDQRKNRGWVFMNFVFGRSRFYYFPKENLRYFDPDEITVEFLASLNDCEIFIDEGQWIFDSYEGTKFSKEKRRLILHTRHLNRSLNIISQRTQSIQVSARGQVNVFYKCVKKSTWPFLVFQRVRFEDMINNDVDETQPSGTKVYLGSKRILNAYNTHSMRGNDAMEQKVAYKYYDLSTYEKFVLILFHIPWIGKKLSPVFQHLKDLTKQ